METHNNTKEKDNTSSFPTDSKLCQGERLVDIPDTTENVQWFVNMIIDDNISMLSHLLKAIEKWDELAITEFKMFEQEISVKHSDGFSYGYDPITDELFINHHTGLALYGSLAVAIASKVEDMLPYILRMLGAPDIMKDGKPSTKLKKPLFVDYLFTLEQKCGCTRNDVIHYNDHLFVRELANRFKHSGGKSTQEFVDQYKGISGVGLADQDIPFDRYDWKSYIGHAKLFLNDVAQRLNDATRRIEK